MWPVKAGARPGLTLAELAVVIALLGLAGAAIGVTLLRQQRFYRGAAELLRAREGVRDALEVLSSDIRGLEASDTIRLRSDSAVEFFAGIGSSVVCQVPATDRVTLPAVGATRGNTLSAFLTHPDTGDLVFLYSDSANAGGGGWERHRISAFSSSSDATPCLFANDPTGHDRPVTGFVLTLFASLRNAPKPGSPVRFARRGRYSLYRSADGAWYLGYRRCNALGASACGAIQPVSGPYRRHSADPSATGLLFEYFGAHGRRLAPSGSPLDLARVDITARAESPEGIVVENGAKGVGDSATVSVALRNRAR